MRRVRVRPVPPNEVHDLFAFFSEQSRLSKEIAPRPLEEQRGAANNSLLFVVESEGAYVGVSGAYPEEPAPGGKVESFELGNTILRPDVRGFRLQRWLQEIRIITLEVLHDARAVLAIDPRNAASYRNALEVGFRRRCAVPAAVLGPCAYCPKRPAQLKQLEDCCCDFLEMPSSGLRAVAARALQWRPVEQTIPNVSGDRLELRLDVPVLRVPLFREALATTAEGM